MQNLKLGRARRLTSSFVAMVVALTGLVSLFTPQAAAAAPSALGALAGAVIHKEAMTLPAELQPIATGKRVLYLSSDVHNRLKIVSGTIITPKTQPANPKVVAWAHGTTGIGDHCAPSKNLNVFWPEATAAVASYLQKGWTVAATDYPGLGTPGQHHYFIGESEGRAVIDSVRAARKLDSKLTNTWAVSGHSQGGQAALFAGEIADTYGNGLNLKGSVAIAPVSNEDIIAPGAVGTPGQGYLVLALFGLSAVDASVDPMALLAQPAKDKLPVLQTGCTEEILTAFAPLTAEELLVGGQLPQDVVTKLAHYGNPAQQASTVPVLLVQGTADDAVPADITALLQTQICAHNTPTFLHMLQGADHITSVTQSTGFVADYINGRFTNAPAPNNC